MAKKTPPKTSRTLIYTLTLVSLLLAAGIAWTAPDAVTGAAAAGAFLRDASIFSTAVLAASTTAARR
jgi:hypothetical protein